MGERLLLDLDDYEEITSKKWEDGFSHNGLNEASAQVNNRQSVKEWQQPYIEKVNHVH